MHTLTSPSPTDVTASAFGVPITFVTTQPELVDMFDRLDKATHVALDTETEVFEPDDGPWDFARHGPGFLRVISLGAIFSDGSEHSWVLDVGPSPSPAGPLDLQAVSARFATLRPAAWNASFDEEALRRWAGISVSYWRDLMFERAHHCLGVPGERVFHSLAQAAQTHLGLSSEGKADGTRLSFDRETPLTDEQVRYAAEDAVVTVRLSRVFDALTDELGVAEAVRLDNVARPFLNWMSRAGAPFDTVGWGAFLADKLEDLAAVESQLATLTGGGEVTLFGESDRPAWNPASQADVKKVLNEWAADAVRSALGRALTAEDSVDVAMLERIDHPLAEAMMTHRELEKLRSTYGDTFMAMVTADGRVHARFNQVLAVTGRLSSDRPNLQNLSPLMKPYFRSPNAPTRNGDGTWDVKPDSRVLVMADLSQAELRALAHIADDPVLRADFEAGKDMHVATASRMFVVDLDTVYNPSVDLPLRVAATGTFAADLVSDVAKEIGAAPNLEAVLATEAGPEALSAALSGFYSSMRQRGKTLNFANIYGLSARVLADTLTRANVPTTTSEAENLQTKYFEAFPQAAKFLLGTAAEVAEIAEGFPQINWPETRRQHRLYGKATSEKFRLRRELDRFPTPSEIAERVIPRHSILSKLAAEFGREPTPAEVDARLAELRSDVEMVAALPSVRLLRSDTGKPFEFVQRTGSGRRRVFTLTADQVYKAAATLAAGSRKPHMTSVRAEFAEQYGVRLQGRDGRTLSRSGLEALFGNKRNVELWLTHLGSAFPPDRAAPAMTWLLARAATNLVQRMANAYRNAPIQGGVADATLETFGLLYDRLIDTASVVPIQTVHDSIVVECDAADALWVADILVEAMTEGMNLWFATVPARVDVDICASLDAKTTTLPSAALEAVRRPQ